MNKTSWLQWIGAVALVVSVVTASLFYSFTHPKTNNFGAATTAGNMLIENYIPYVLYNGGINSAKDISTTANINGAVGTFSSSLVVPTVANATTTATAGCLSTYATSSATQIKLAFNTSATSTSINGGTVQGVVVWQYGSCPI